MCLCSRPSSAPCGDVWQQPGIATASKHALATERCMSKMEFPQTKAYAKIYQFLIEADASIRGETQSQNAAVIKILGFVEELIENTPLESKRDRFANPALKKLHAAISTLETETDCDVYLKNSFGNAIRLDYGTGHELNFLCFLYALNASGAMKVSEVFLTMRRYFQIIRKMIVKFNAEPAGSHGLWGLDDYQFLPFLLGSSELHNSACVLDNLRQDSCYSEAIAFVKETKGRGNIPLEFVAPKLYSMRNMRWQAINMRLFRMYNEDVLRSEVVYQHFIYSKYLEKDPPGS